MAEIPIFLDAEAASFPPGQRLVVPQAASVETDIPANLSHIAQHRRGDGRGGLGKDRIVLPQEFRMLNDVECGQSADFDAISGLRTDSPQFWDMANIEHILWLKQFLTHRGNQIRTACKHADARVLCQESNCFFEAPRAPQLELREAQSSPPASTMVSRRAGSSGCRSGPLPRNQIGRASCRERMEISVVQECFKQKCTTNRRKSH